MYQSIPTTQTVPSGMMPIADRGQLLMRYYDSVLTHMDSAAGHLLAENAMAAQESLYLAASLVAELIRALDPTQASELCANLELLYMTVVDKLVEANDTADNAPISQAKEIMLQLRSAWAQII